MSNSKPTGLNPAPAHQSKHTIHPNPQRSHTLQPTANPPPPPYCPYSQPAPSPNTNATAFPKPTKQAAKHFAAQNPERKRKKIRKISYLIIISRPNRPRAESPPPPMIFPPSYSAIDIEGPGVDCDDSALGARCGIWKGAAAAPWVYPIPRGRLLPIRMVMAWWLLLLFYSFLAFFLYFTLLFRGCFSDSASGKRVFLEDSLRYNLSTSDGWIWFWCEM